MKTQSIAFLVALVVVAASRSRAEDDDAARREIAAMQGEWTMASGAADGYPIPDAMLRDFRRVCKGDEVVTTVAGRVYMKATIKVDPSKSPKTIDYAVTDGPTRGKTQLGIYQLEGDTFKSCFAAPGADRPADFTSKPGDQRTSTVWKRAAKPAEPAPMAKAPAEDDFYPNQSFDIPDDIVLEVGAMEVMPDGTLAVSTRRGDVYMVANAFEGATTSKKPRFSLWASGMHEVLGLAQRDGWLYAVQRGEVTRLKDLDGDGRADVYETFCDDWGISGDYHEYPIGSKFDREGNLYVTLCLTGSFTSEAEFRGWCMKITPDGKAVPFASGIRSPGGVGFNLAGDLFYTDNQGPWNGTSSLKHLTPGAFEGHPIGNKWYSLAKNLGPRPQDPKSGSRFHIEAEKVKQYVPPACLLPHQKVGQSASGIACDASGGKFGPFQGHLFVGDQHHSNLTRVVLEKVNDRYQGVAIPFRSGFSSGIVPVIQAPDGSLFAGGTNRGWGSVGPKEYALERLVWTGKTPFELLDMKARPDGFELTFTQPVDKTSAGGVKSYSMETFTYIFQAEYGSPEVDRTKPTIQSATVSDDGLRVRLKVDGLEVGHIHELKLPGVRAAAGNSPLLHPIAWYTLWNIPKQEQASR